MADSQVPAWDRLESFWLKPISTARFAVVRTLLGLTVLLWALSLIPDLLTIYGTNGFTDGLRVGRSHVFVIFRFLDGTAVVVACFVLLVACSIALIVGRFTRIALPVMAVLLITFTVVGRSFFIGTENVMRVLTVELAIFAAVTPSWYLDRPVFRPAPTRMVPGWGIRLVQVQMTVLYVITAIAKWQGAAWREGVAVLDALTPVHTLRFGAPAALTESELVVRLLTWGVLAFETILPLILWHPRTRRLAVILAFVMHVSFGIFIEIGFFALALAVGLVAFLSDRDAERLIAPLRGTGRHARSV